MLRVPSPASPAHDKRIERLPWASASGAQGREDPDFRFAGVLRANVYKCGDRTSHPHWMSWNPVRTLNFHAPDEFGQLIFA